MVTVTEKATAAQGAATAKKRGRPSMKSADPKQIIANAAKKMININQGVIEKLQKTM